MLKNAQSLIGTWLAVWPPGSKDSYAREYIISMANGKFRVRAKELQDGENFKISNVKYNDQTLEFTSLMPSTGRIGVNKFQLKDRYHIEAEFTFTTIEKLERKLDSRSKIVKKDHPLVGIWVSASLYNDDYLCAYTISIEKGKFRVKARELQDGEHFRISNVKYNDQTLEFTSLMPSTGRIGVNKFQLKDRYHIEAEFTFTIIEELGSLLKVQERGQSPRRGQGKTTAG